MSNFVIIAVCLMAGGIIRRLGHFRREDARPLNTVVLWLSLPALIFVEVPRIFREIPLGSEILWTAGMPWAQFAVALAGALLYRKMTGASLKVVGALALTAGLGNTSFVGFPVIEAFYGLTGIRYGLLIDQLGSFLVVATAGLVVATVCAGRKMQLSAVAKRVLVFPPFISFCLSVVWGLSSLPVDGFVVDGLRRLGGTVVPISLVSVGWQLSLSRVELRRYRLPLALGLGFKLLLWPLVFGGVLAAAVDTSTLMYKVTVLEAAMAPMITAAVVAADFELEPELAQLMVGVGIPLSLITLSIWHWFL